MDVEIRPGIVVVGLYAVTGLRRGLAQVIRGHHGCGRLHTPR